MLQQQQQASKSLASAWRGGVLEQRSVRDLMSGGADEETRRSWSCARLWLLVVCALTSLSVGVVVSKSTGFSNHPHRGFETGAFTHQDFAGHKGTIRTGDVQWMTAGRGIVHSEMPAGDDVHKGLQLWINLSSKYKMIEPQYQELERKDISRGESENGGVEALGVATPVYTHPHHVCGLHHAPRVSPAPARPGGLECLRLRR
ncbi:Pirin-like protein 2 [Zea mays]|uniref:Pirin-like protein 2 n=1 Tax=Zea mays TaxID=4577 RepID=A0A1D6P132_MAIZE|nr:Pirin-like protein 2 [Zea mays]